MSPDQPKRPAREFPRDWLKSVMLNDLLAWKELNPDHAFIGPHAALNAIEIYDEILTLARELAYALNHRSIQMFATEFEQKLLTRAKEKGLIE